MSQLGPLLLDASRAADASPPEAILPLERAVTAIDLALATLRPKS